jgi:rod shape-determining protein MreC
MTRVATPIKVWAPRFIFVVLVALSLSLMVLDRYNARLVEQARLAVMDGVTPFLDLMSRPVDTIAKWMESADELIYLRSENARLKLENDRLLQWQQAARRLEAENAALRELLHLAPQPVEAFVTARAVAGPGGAYVRSLLVNAGSDQGVHEGQAAVTGDGLAGRVLHVGRRSARVLLITDINSRIPVVVGDSRDRAVLGGDNTGSPRLLYVDPKVEVRAGARVETSGHGGALPPGIPVGVVSTVAEEEARVTPFVDWGHVDYLRMVSYGRSDQLDEFSSGPPGGAAR